MLGMLAFIALVLIGIGGPMVWLVHRESEWLHEQHERLNGPPRRPQGGHNRRFP